MGGARRGPGPRWARRRPAGSEAGSGPEDRAGLLGGRGLRRLSRRSRRCEVFQTLLPAGAGWSFKSYRLQRLGACVWTKKIGTFEKGK